MNIYNLLPLLAIPFLQMIWHPQKGGEALKDPSQTVDPTYSKDIIKIVEEDTIIYGLEHVRDFLIHASYDPESYHTDARVLANVNRGISYELGWLHDTYGNKHRLVRILEKRNSLEKVVFEFSAVANSTGDELDKIKRQREKWIKICNQHSAAALVNEMYTEQTIYYNHKPLIIGRANLIPEYGYMNRETYSLELHPLHIQQVSDTYVYEIGQCRGSYNGKYILIWKKEEDGQWRVFVDSNI